jgi:hypothetical protein
MWERRTEQPLFWKGLIINLQAKLRSIVTAGGAMTDIEKTNNISSYICAKIPLKVNVFQCGESWNFVTIGKYKHCEK